MSAATRERPACYRVVSRVHDDDIHGIVVTPASKEGQKIISGSKDTTVKIFDLEGNFERVLSQNPAGSSYQNWVTAIDIFPDGSFLAGHRNAYLLCRSFLRKETFMSQKMEPLLSEDREWPPVGGAGSGGKAYKKRNEKRVMAVKTAFEKDSSAYLAFVGFAEIFCKIDCGSGEIVKQYQFSAREWVYGFQALSPTVFLAIHGCRLSLFSEEEESFRLQETLVDEDFKARKKRGIQQSPFISSVLSMPSSGESGEQVALSFFGGVNQVLDVKSGKAIHSAQEHSERVWQAVPFSPFEYATCADDAWIKLWDIRSGTSSVKTYGGHPGRVSALAFLSDKQFVAGTCAPDPFADPHKGEFYFYDCRGTK